MSQLKCLLDMDGVLVDFISGAIKLHNLPCHPYDNPKMHGIWDFVPSLGMSENEFWKNADQKFWSELEPTEECFEIVKMMEAEFGQDNICLLTSPCLNHGCIPGKMEWIEKYLPAYKCRFLAGPRKEFCAHNKAILVDDNDNNLRAFNAHGGWVIPVPRKWNQYHTYHNTPMNIIRTTLNVLKESLRWQ